MKTKVKYLVAEWVFLKTNTLRVCEIQRKKEADFVEKLADLFDIAYGNALKMVADPENAVFLQLQREKGRPGCIAGVDENLNENPEKASGTTSDRRRTGETRKTSNRDETAGEYYDCY